MIKRLIQTLFITLPILVLTACDGSSTDGAKPIEDNAVEWQQYLGAHTRGEVSKNSKIVIRFINDIADEHQVGTDAVGVVNISPEVKEQVKKLAEEWDYRPNPLAMGLLRQNTRTIGVIVPDLVTHFFSSVISGIESYARDQGYYIIISSSYESYQKEKECIENLLSSRVEGLIVSLSYQTEDVGHFEELVRKGIPMVFFDRVCLPDKVDCRSGNPDERKPVVVQSQID